MTTERRRVIYEGRVQGVGFRMTTRRLASAFPVSGYVQNLADGRAEVLVQGDPGALNEFLAAINREFADGIVGTSEEIFPSGDDLGLLFSIR